MQIKVYQPKADQWLSSDVNRLKDGLWGGMKTTFVVIKLLKNIASGSDYISLCLAEGEEISGS